MELSKNEYFIHKESGIIATKTYPNGVILEGAKKVFKFTHQRCLDRTHPALFGIIFYRCIPLRGDLEDVYIPQSIIEGKNIHDWRKLEDEEVNNFNLEN